MAWLMWAWHTHVHGQQKDESVTDLGQGSARCCDVCGGGLGVVRHLGFRATPC
jgi:hypothetical protein